MILNNQFFFKYLSVPLGGLLLLLSFQPTFSIEANSTSQAEQFPSSYPPPLADPTFSEPSTAQGNEASTSFPTINKETSAGNQKISKSRLWTVNDGLSQPENYETQYPVKTAGTDLDSQFDAPPAFQNENAFEQNEILAAGHSFFGTVTSGLANGIQYLFQSQGKPNAYILGEDAGGAFLLGLRYGEGNMHLKYAPPEKVFWQGPTIGYDAGAEGSKTMILVYNLEAPSQIYDRYAGFQGAVYFIGGVSIQLQKHGNVTLALIRSGLGLRLGANVGYLNYTRTPSWNPL